jgi:[protein-PII] uridylyltransferase
MEPQTTDTASRGDRREARAAQFAAARRELAEASAAGDGGRQALRQYSHRMDAMVQQLFAEAGPVAQPVGIFALGGYGRRELCLFSDIDLLVLFAGPIGAADEPFLHAFLNPLWDFGLTVGQQVREVQDGAHVDADNPEFLLALTDARPVAGDATLFDRFLDAGDGARRATTTLDALRALMAERHARYNDTFYQLEPDVKEAPGGLRDLFAARTIAKLTDPMLLAQGGPGPRALDESEEFLLRVRSVLHFEAGRHANALSHEMQERAAVRLRYSGAGARQQVERLMSEYFRHARTVDRALRWALRAAPTPIGPNLVRSPSGIRFVDDRLAATRPETWLTVFRAALDQGAAVSDEALSLIEQHVTRFAPEAFVPTPAHRRALLAFLRPRPGLYAALSQMHDTGLLGQIFPEFRAITCRVVRDFYHKYTVDEHTLLTIRNLERLAAAGPGRQRFARLLAELEAPELLVLALLYHDTGKWRDDDHAVESGRLARAMFDRLGLDDQARATVTFLIEQHLQMSKAAFRRDTEDPEVVRRFADLVGVEDRLKMLCLMTLADVEAVSRDTLTPWKEELLWQLYVDTYNQLTLSYGDEVIERSRTAIVELIDGRPSDLSVADVEGFLEGLPRRYLRLFPADAVYRHVRESRDVGPDTLRAWLEPGPNPDEWALTVVARDRPFLFSNISGVLSSFGMDILRGFAFTKPNGLVVDMFHVVDTERFLALNDDGDARVMRRLDDVIMGGTDIAARLKGREEGVLRRRLPGFAPVIHCDNESSRRYTIVEIVAENALGLLYRVSRAMSESGCDVDLVLINTEGQRAIDVFHLTRAGAKLTSAEQQILTANVQRVLEGHS